MDSAVYFTWAINYARKMFTKLSAGLNVVRNFSCITDDKAS